MRVLRCSIRSRRASRLSVRWSESVGQGLDVSLWIHEGCVTFCQKPTVLIIFCSRRDSSSNRRLCETTLGPGAASRGQLNVRQDALVRQGSRLWH